MLSRKVSIVVSLLWISFWIEPISRCLVFFVFGIILFNLNQLLALYLLLYQSVARDIPQNTRGKSPAFGPKCRQPCFNHWCGNGTNPLKNPRDGTRIFQSESWDPYVWSNWDPKIFCDPPDSYHVQELIVGNFCIHSWTSFVQSLQITNTSSPEPRVCSKSSIRHHLLKAEFAAIEIKLF